MAGSSFSGLPVGASVAATDVLVADVGVSSGSAGTTSQVTVSKVFGAMTALNVTTSLGYVPYSAANPAGYVPSSGGTYSGPVTLNAGGVVSGGNTLAIAGTINVTGALVLSSVTIAATGTVQGTAAVLSSQRSIITGGASGTGVQAIAVVGQGWEVWNRSGSAKLIWPASAAQFEGLSVNAAETIADGAKVTIAYVSATQGYVG